MSETSFDLAVIGSGPGGYVAAIRASQLGLKTAIIEREQLGGICLNWGCIPTKALLRTAELYQAMRRAPEFGLAADNVRFDIASVVERSRKVAERLSNGVAYLMRKNKIEVIKGTAHLAGEGRIAVTGKSGEALPDIAAKHIIVATGARARTLPGLEPDGRLIWTYKEAMVPPSFPKSLLIVGSGAIGIEFASFYRSLGRRGDRGRNASPHPTRRGRRDLRPRAQGVRAARHRHSHRNACRAVDQRCRQRDRAPAQA